MAELLPADIGVVVLVVAVILYAFIWFATRRLPRFAQILARVAPLAIITPLLFYLATQPTVVADAPPPEPVPGGNDHGSPGSTAVERTGDSARRVSVAPPAPGSGGAPPPPQVVGQAQESSDQTDDPAAVHAAEEARRRQEVARAEAEREAERIAEAEARAARAREPVVATAPATAPDVSSPGPVGAPLPEQVASPRAPSPPPAVRRSGARGEGGGGAPPPGVPAASQADWDVVPVFYGTDRRRKDDPKRTGYGSERAHRLELGHALVTVPKSHQVPNIERPFALRIPIIQVTIYEQAEDPKKHFTIKDVNVLSRDEFVTMARARVGGSRSFKDQAVVFVHGYNSEFDYALYRTAQMAYDLQFDGASFLYSWPSGGAFTSYGYDRESSTQAEPYLREFLSLVVKETGAKSVSVIAHSMGNWPLLNVLRELGPSLPPGVQLNEIILAAPDVDRDVFVNLAQNIRKYGRGVTLYCSANDRAMEAARRVAGGIPRAGDVPSDGPVVLTGIDTIDVTQTSTDYLALNHSTYAERSALINDIGLLLQTGTRPPDQRVPILQRVSTPRGEFWRYPVIPR